MAKKEAAPKKKTTTVILTTPHGYAHLSEIAREGGWPTIVDRSEHAVEWLKAHGYKVTDIEIVGQKPANFDTVFEIAPPASVEAPLVEKVEAVLEAPSVPIVEGSEQVVSPVEVPPVEKVETVSEQAVPVEA